MTDVTDPTPDPDVAYLTSNGWLPVAGYWTRAEWPLVEQSQSYQQGRTVVSQDDALTIQRACDRAEECKAWVAFAAAALASNVERSSSDEDCAEWANHMLDQYRRRFARSTNEE